MILTLPEIEDFARGAAFLGAGGGGDPYIGRLMLEQAMRSSGPVEFVDIEDVDDEALLIPAAMMGAPTVIIEKLPNGAEAETALRALERFLGRNATAIMPAEIGGLNALLPVVMAARLGLPVVDCDGMGRAFPELQMVTFSVFGHAASPLAITDESGNTVLIQAKDDLDAERLARHTILAMGASAQICCYPMTGADVKECGVRGTLTLAYEIGRAIRIAREKHGDPFAALLDYLQTADYYQHCKVLFDGKVMDISRETRKGFAIGTVTIVETGGNRTMTVQFQNENLVAYVDGTLVAVVPDLIIILDRETAEPITTEGVKFGQRVKVMGVSAPPVLRSEKALASFGPRCFGLDEDFRPIETL